MTSILKFALVIACLGFFDARAQTGTAETAKDQIISGGVRIVNPWREVAPENLLLITTRYGTTAIELNTQFSPNHAERIRRLAREGFYDGEYFYRVIDGFVAQAGVQQDERMGDWAGIANENDRALHEGSMTPFGNGDLFAPAVGHSAAGFPMAQDQTLGREWLLHCPGAVAMARDNDPESGGTEFYITLAPQRYLDRNLTVFGRVIDGMQYLQKLERGNRSIAGGVIQPPQTGDQIISVKLAADLPETERPAYLVQRPGTEVFEASKTARRVREEAFFYRKPPEVLDICGFEVPVRRVDPPKAT